MKKLLSLLSVLTIGATSVPTVIAASPYQKEEKINNLENLKRNKREEKIEQNENQETLNKINRILFSKNKTQHVLKPPTNHESINHMIPYPIITIYTFTKDSTYRKKGDIYFGTTNGVYLRKVDESITTKISGIDGPILLIQGIDIWNDVHVITNSGDFYFLRSDLVVTKESVPYPVTTMYTFTKDGNNRKTNDIYFGTTNGIYLRKAGELNTTKIDIIDGNVKLIQGYPDEWNAVHVVVEKKLNNTELYYLNGAFHHARNRDNYIEKQNIPYPITTMYTFTENKRNRFIGDIYFGTTNGLYLRKAGELSPTKIAGIDGPISLIQPYSDRYGSGSVYIQDYYGNIYFVSGDGRVEKQNIPYPVTTMYTFAKNEGNHNVGDIYFGTTNGLYLRKLGETITKINGIDGPILLINKYDSNIELLTIKPNNKRILMDRNSNDNSHNNKNICNTEVIKIQSNQNNNQVIQLQNQIQQLQNEIEQLQNEINDRVLEISNNDKIKNLKNQLQKNKDEYQQSQTKNNWNKFCNFFGSNIFVPSVVGYVIGATGGVLIQTFHNEDNTWRAASEGAFYSGPIGALSSQLSTSLLILINNYFNKRNQQIQNENIELQNQIQQIQNENIELQNQRLQNQIQQIQNQVNQKKNQIQQLQNQIQEILGHVVVPNE